MDEINYIVFPNFYIYKTEAGWYWVNRAATCSSHAAFDFPQFCALDAERTLNGTGAKDAARPR